MYVIKRTLFYHTTSPILYMHLHVGVMLSKRMTYNFFGMRAIRVGNDSAAGFFRRDLIL
jgi:hypothetical protein